MTTASRRGRAYAITIASAAWAALATIFIVGTTGCGIPRLDVEARPGSASIYLDGSRVGQPDAPDSPIAPNYRRVGQDASMRLPYYGTTLVTGDVLDSLDWQRNRKLATVEEPFSPWLFPFDFVLELASYPFQDDRYDHRVDLALEPRPRATVGIRPRNVPGLLDRARVAREER